MRVRYSWVLALFIAGCQLTQPQQEMSDTNTADNTNHPRVAKANAKPARSDDKEIINEPIVTPQSQQDVWRRIGMQLSLPVPDNKLVDYYRDWYLKHPGHFEIVAQRAAPFLYLITEKIEQKGLPLELALLPIVESSFDAFAYSHGSAAGLWQFVPATGKMYGLKQNYWYDGRRDVDAATDAALDYLDSLAQRFDGDWSHAIAAYNSGGGRIASAIRKNVQQGKPTDFFSLDLPQETSGYVPKLLALADIVANQDKYGIHIPEIPNQPRVELVNPSEQLDLAIAAGYAGISVKELQSLNPAYNKWSTAPEGPHSLLLPINSVTQFNEQVAQNRGKGLKTIRYRVESGDTISTLAEEYNTSSQVIRTANGLSSNSIRIGQYLLIPTSVKDEKAYILSAANRLAKKQSVARGQYKVEHIVAHGDSLWTIAKEHNVAYDALAKWNGMGPRDTLRIGQKLVIWKKPSDGAIIRTVLYKVRNGDTISGIANKFRVKSQDIVEWNSLGQQKYLQPGQQLKLYVDITKVSV